MKKLAGQTKKSAGQAKASGEASLASIYLKLKEVLSRHAPPLKLCEMEIGKKSGVQLVVPKPVTIPGAYGGKPVNMQLAAAILQKGYVGFYLMCIYMDEKAKKEISPALLRLLKGKSCFHVKTWNDGLENDIEAALVLGTKAYRERGWL